MSTVRDAHLAALEERIGVTFKNRNLLLEATTHRSYLNEHRNHPVAHNELLEFLGDAILELAVTEYLFKRYRGEETEGTLTNWRAAIVNSKTLTQIAREINLEPCLLMSRGETKDAGTKARGYILADAVEALLGAVYCDQGLGAARLMVDALFLAHCTEIIANSRDVKGTFQELVQAKHGPTPTYKVLKEWGLDHARRFVVGLFVGDNKVAEGEGTSKKEAEEAAAKNALQTINAQEGRSRERG